MNLMGSAPSTKPAHIPERRTMNQAIEELEAAVARLTAEVAVTESIPGSDKLVVVYDARGPRVRKRK